MSKFVVGEIAIVINRYTRQRLECEIMAVPGHTMQDFPKEAYVINIPEDQNTNNSSSYHFASEGLLRKRKPPKEELGSWKEVQKITEGWNPIKETINA